jgi:soluble lytic murein transglycosylase
MLAPAADVKERRPSPIRHFGAAALAVGTALAISVAAGSPRVALPDWHPARDILFVQQTGGEIAARLPRPRPAAAGAVEEEAAALPDAPPAMQQAASPAPEETLDVEESTAEVPGPAPVAEAAASVEDATWPIAGIPLTEDDADASRAALEVGLPSTEEPQAVDDVATAPLPRPRPEVGAAEAARLLADQFHGFTPDFALKAALDAASEGRYTEARGLAAEHENALVSALIDWIVALDPSSDLSAAEIIEVLSTHQGWPESDRLLLRAEQAFHALGPDAESILTFYSLAEPRTVGGRLALAGALREVGRAGEANEIVRELWRDWPLAVNQVAAIAARFGPALSREDHLHRFRRLVLTNKGSEAIAQAALIGPHHDELARAVIAVVQRDSNRASLLRGIAPRFLGDPLYVFARVRLLRQTGQPIEAARLLLEFGIDDSVSGNGDAWWEERRDLSRQLLDAGTPDLAYRVVAGAKPEGEGEQVEAAFHAGWYALRFLRDPNLAEPHFRALHALATLPRSQSRASYWLGRAHEAQGKTQAARLDYVEAARFGGTFYGQLAREKLGFTTTGLERTPSPSALDRLRFAERDNVRVIRLLAAAGHADKAGPFLRALGETVDTPGEVALLVTLARRLDRPGDSTRAAVIAERRGLEVASLSAPFLGVPSDLPLPDPVDRALVYAVVRQESAFDHAAVSHAGARGLMQLMPATARATARNIPIPFNAERLTTDPRYNATIGAYHLGELLGDLQRSYVLTFVGYNAGPGRALDWVRAYGDPRRGTADPVDWIERIPFDETRDYVQKVMENLQAYRSRTGYSLSLSKDLVRGGSEG